MRLAIVRSLIFLAGVFAVTTVHDLASRALSANGFTYFHLRSLFEGIVSMAIVVLPGSVLGFRLFGRSEVKLAYVALSGAVYWALIIGSLSVLPNDIPIRRVLAALILFGAPFVLAWGVCAGAKRESPSLHTP